ncbi:MAG: D-alanyl-D-alanine carboxypeptidase family protein, partial [Thermoleophilaceae bacterium]
MTRGGIRRGESGQALLLTLGVVAVLLVGSLVLTAFGQALGGKGHQQRAADLAAMSAAASMRRDYPRLFEPAVLPGGVPNPHHLTTVAYMARARVAAVRGARRNRGTVSLRGVTFPGASFAPTRVAVHLRGTAAVPVGEGDRREVAVTGRAEAELSPGAGASLSQPAFGSGGGYDGPLAYRMGKPMRPDVAEAFDRMAAAARRAGLALSVNSGFRSDAEQARLFAKNPNPKW